MALPGLLLLAVVLLAITVALIRRGDYRRLVAVYAISAFSFGSALARREWGDPAFFASMGILVAASVVLFLRERA